MTRAMFFMTRWFSLGVVLAAAFEASAKEAVPPFPADTNQLLERTCFQTGVAWGANGNLPGDVAVVYGIDADMPRRVQTWRDRGYRIHLMTGVSWGNYQDFLYGRFDGINHEDEAQTVSDGRKSSHGGDVYYMCPSTNYGKFLCVGIQRALDAGVEAIHLEEPEFWVNSGYSAGFKREWQAYYGEPWQAPHSSADAQWRASKLKYYLYRRTLQQIFDYVQDYNQRTGKKVRCYVPTHSLLNYSHWCIVSPESSLARLNGCDGYIAQVWTGTSRTPNKFRGELRERTFETAFLEYGAMQNLVRATGRAVWYLNDPIEDNPNHDWNDYQRNWESTLVASLLQPEVWRYEIAPWPERIFGGRYPRSARREDRQPIPPAYATELQVVMNRLNDLKQSKVEWDCGTTGLGVLVSDSLMFQRGDPTPSDPHMGHFYGLALPLVKRGMPVTPVQLENITLTNYLSPFRVLQLTYQGMKPLSPEVHVALAAWVKSGGSLVVWDDDSDPFNRVREWWNSDGRQYRTPREHLFELLGYDRAVSHGASTAVAQARWKYGRGNVTWVRENPARLANSREGDARVVEVLEQAVRGAGLAWRENNYLLLRRGPYVVAAGLDESAPGSVKELHGQFINLFDDKLKVQRRVALAPGSRFFLLDLQAIPGNGLAHLVSAGKVFEASRTAQVLVLTVEGVDKTPGVVLLRTEKIPKSIEMDGQPVAFEYAASERLLWIRFENESCPRNLKIEF
jgi:hypothetical protein